MVNSVHTFPLQALTLVSKRSSVIGLTCRQLYTSSMFKAGYLPHVLPDTAVIADTVIPITFSVPEVVEIKILTSSFLACSIRLLQFCACSILMSAIMGPVVVILLVAMSLMLCVGWLWHYGALRFCVEKLRQYMTRLHSAYMRSFKGS